MLLPYEPSHQPCCGWGERPNRRPPPLPSRTPFADFDFDALLLVMTQHQLMRQPAKDWSRPLFKGQFPFPLAPEFWGSWNDS
jgi:hypothetical protein